MLTREGNWHMDERRTSRIRNRAYELFLQRRNGPGDAVRDWLEAENEIREEERGHHGPARMPDSAHHGRLTDPDGRDVENPT